MLFQVCRVSMLCRLHDLITYIPAVNTHGLCGAVYSKQQLITVLRKFLAEVKYNVGSAKMRSFMFVITKLR